MPALRLENSPLIKVIPTRLDKDTYSQLVAVAKHRSISQTALVRLAIREYLITQISPQTSKAPTPANTA